jgi:hypothetical protein
MGEIKKLFTDLLIFGHTISKPQLIVMISLLYDKTFDSDYNCIELNGNTLFVEKCLLYFLAAKKELESNQEITEIDNFIDDYRALLIESEMYELLNLLKI